MSKQELFNLIQTAFDVIVLVVLFLQHAVNELQRKRDRDLKTRMESIRDMLDRATREP